MDAIPSFKGWGQDWHGDKIRKELKGESGEGRELSNQRFYIVFTVKVNTLCKEYRYVYY